MKPKLNYINLSLLLSFFVIWWTCSLEKIDPSVKFDPCLGKVTAKFSHDKLGISCDSPCVVKFTNSSTGAKSYAWDFGEGGKSTEANPTYTFKKSGRFDVKLTVTNDEGCSTTTMEVVTVSVPNLPDPIPDFTFTYLNSNQNAPSNVVFSNTSQNADTYKWDFGTGKDSSTQKSPQFLYTLNDDFLVKLEATNKVGVKRQITKLISIKAITFKKFFNSANNLLDGYDVIILGNNEGYGIVGRYLGYVERIPNTLIIKTDIKGNLSLISIVTKNDISNSKENVSGSLVQSSVDKTIATLGYDIDTSGDVNMLFMKMGNINYATYLTLIKKFGIKTRVEYGGSLYNTLDGGFLLIGRYSTINSNTGSGIYLVKVNNSGLLQWEKTIENNSKTIIVMQSLDNNISVFTQDNNNKSTLIKLDESGNLLLTSPVNTTTQITRMSTTIDKGNVFCGRNKLQELYVLKTDDLGNKLWENTYPNLTDVSSINQCKDEGYIISGFGTSLSNLVQIVKIDKSGKQSWANSFDIPNSTVWKVLQATDGGFILIVLANSTSNPNQICLIKTDKDGNIQ
jgi:PKD repeat protein